MGSKVEDVLAISRTLIALENEERELHLKIAEAREQLAKMVGKEKSPSRKRTPPTPPPPPVENPTQDIDPSLGDYGSRGGYGQRGLTGKVLNYMKANPTQFISPEVVTKDMNLPEKNEVMSKMLQRLAKAGLIERVHRGLYRYVPGKELDKPIWKREAKND